MRAPGIVAFLLVLCSAAAYGSVPLPFHLTPQGAIIVPVTVEGSGPFAFLLDTGSNGSVISDELATALGSRIVARTTVMSGAGQKAALVARIEQLAMGGVTATGVLATVAAVGLDLPDVAASGRRVQGVIGQDVLGALRYTIDYRARQIVWREVDADVPSRASVFSLEPQDDRFLVRLPQAHGMLRLVPDTGAEALVLYERDGIVPVAATCRRERVTVTSLSGVRPARPAVVRALRVGATTMTDVAAVIVAAEHGAPGGDGLLPLHLFKRVTFNGPERQLVIED
jgi:predicted aspartyl protease